ncbi:DNA topoisomerase IB [Mesorhizobium sp. BAC0120]|uniref:DNA topoisomerase IB n=1 Tax=Mesorhizobium sp. BAC0120 TaxID=3090670 RepID=UPI00298BEF94|nr:DNA topoisomerase IB [Mesorhizobium sp. BAC0120]MDW6023570.1 DNA topoisomerase IB [Mesorhizobium sp. BAC0120]
MRASLDEANARDAIISAEAASLIYGSDTEPGIRRKRMGKQFRYTDPQGRTITDPATLERIKRLAIPPAWSDVWISPSPDGHVQATGRDDRGRKQYRYHPRWTACRDEVKYSSLTAFARALPRLRRRIDADLRRRGLPRERVIASIVWLLDHTLIRVGNTAYARENKSFGLTTLRDRHVTVEGSSLRFAFRGKSGKEWKLRISDRRIVKIVKGAQDIPGQHLFQYLNADGSRGAVVSQDVNDYIRNAGKADFTSKHFRTWGGTTRAVEILATTERPQTKREMALVMNRAIDEVAARLGNTRAVCRRCYIHPLVLEAWQEGRLAGELAAVKSRFRKVPRGLDVAEAIVLRWLENAERSNAA